MHCILLWPRPPHRWYGRVTQVSGLMVHTRPAPSPTQWDSQSVRSSVTQAGILGAVSCQVKRCEERSDLDYH